MFSMDVAMICRQTSYTVEEATAKLSELKDPLLVIQEYMGIRPSPPTPPQPYSILNEFMNLKNR